MDNQAPNNYNNGNYNGGDNYNNGNNYNNNNNNGNNNNDNNKKNHNGQMILGFIMKKVLRQRKLIFMIAKNILLKRNI